MGVSDDPRFTVKTSCEALTRPMKIAMNKTATGFAGPRAAFASFPPA